MKLLICLCLIFISANCFCIDDFDLEFYVNPCSTIEPLERYQKRYDWDLDVAGKIWLNDNRKAREIHSENIDAYTKTLFPIIDKKIYLYREKDFFDKELMKASIRRYLQNNMGKSNCKIDNLVSYTLNQMLCLASIKTALQIAKNRHLLPQETIDRIRINYKKLDEECLSHVIGKYQDRNFFYENGVSHFSVIEIEYPLTEKQIAHLNGEVGNITKLSESFNSLKSADEDYYYNDWVISPSVLNFLKNKGWKLEDIKKASNKSYGMENYGFYLNDYFFLSESKMWCWDEYLRGTITGCFLWFFYGVWLS